jgi:hypothetical protein
MQTATTQLLDPASRATAHGVDRRCYRASRPTKDGPTQTATTQHLLPASRATARGVDRGC